MTKYTQEQVELLLKQAKEDPPIGHKLLEDSIKRIHKGTSNKK